MPAEAKNDKKLIFADKYEDVFTEEITADALLTVMRLFNEIEAKKMKRKREMLNDPSLYDEESFILYATYYILYVISELACLESIKTDQKNYHQISGLYNKAIDVIKQAIGKEKSEIGTKYSHGLFFKNNRAKLHIQKILGIS